MSSLLEIRENIRNFYSRNEVYLLPFLKFLLALVALLMINGKIEAVVQDARSYQELMDRVNALEEETQILLGLADAEAGKGADARAFFKKLRESVDENV